MYATVTGLSILLYKPLQEPYECYVIVRVYLSLSSRLRDLRERAKNKYTINSLVSDLFCDRQCM